MRTNAVLREVKPPAAVKRDEKHSGERRVTPRGLLAIALLGSLVAALFGADPLASWADGLPDVPGVATLQSATAAWRDVTQRLYLDKPYDVLHRAIRTVEAFRFSD